MKIGDTVNFYLFGVPAEGEVYNINPKEKTVSILHEGYKYSEVKTFSKLPKKKSDIPPWYILKTKKR